MSNSKIITRQGESVARVKAHRNLAEVGNLKSTFKSSKAKVRALQDTLKLEEEKLQAILNQAESTNNALSAAQEEIDMDPLPEGAQPVSRINNRNLLRLKVKQINIAVDAQRESLKRAKETVRNAEKDLFTADKSLHQFVDSLQDTQTALEVQADLDKEMSSSLAAYEVARAQRWEREQQEAIDARAAQVRELHEIAQQQVASTKILHKDAVSRIKEANQETVKVTRKIQELKEKRLLDRIDAVLELKTNQDAISAQVASQAAKYRRRVQEAQRELEDEKEGMVAQGLNPYAEVRRREFEEEARSREERMKRAVERNKVELASKLVKEEDASRRENIKVMRDKAYEKKFRNELGRHVIEERNRQYIVDTTMDHREVLDPSGRESRVDPSQITDIPDYTFGLGRSARIPAPNMRRITEKVRAALRVDRSELGEYTRLVRALLPPDASPGGAGGGADMMRSHSAPGRQVVDSSDEESLGAEEDLDGEDDEERYSESRLRELKSLAIGTDRASIPGSLGAAPQINLPGEEEEARRLLAIAAEGADGVFVSGDADGTYLEEPPKYPVPKLSKFEENAFARAKEKQRQRQLEGSDQVAGGRVFSGAGFAAKPECLEYVDFEVGKTYKKRFTLTNISYTFNAFRLQPLADDVADFFTVSFEKPGRMSAGVSCSIEVTFKPRVNRDLSSNVRFLTETGPLEVPLRCRIRRCIPDIVTPVIECGEVVLGQLVTRQLRIKNLGAIPTSFTISRVEAPVSDHASAGVEASAEDTEDDVLSSEPALQEAELMARVKRTVTLVERRKRRQHPFPLSVPEEGLLEGYGETSLDVTCAPLVSGQLEQVCTVIFSGVRDIDKIAPPTDGVAAQSEQQFTITALAQELPIYAAEEVVDLKCTLFDRIYRTRVELRNRASSAYKVAVRLSPSLQPYVELSPSTVFVQAGGAQTLGLKFTPTKEMVQKLAHYSVTNEGFENAVKLALPLEIRAANQELPVFFILKCEVCQSTLDLSSRLLDFGSVYVNQEATATLTIKNTSMLAQKLAFVKLRREISVQPYDGFCSLLPNEEVTVNVTLSPPSVTSFDWDLKISSSLGENYSVKIKAEVVEAPVSFDEPVIHMAATGPGEKVVASTFVRSNANVPQTVEIGHPNPCFSWLRFAPSVIELPARGFCRVEMQYTPPENLLGCSPEQWKTQLEAEDAASPFSRWTQSDDWMVASGVLGEVRWATSQEKSDSREPIDPDVECSSSVELETEDGGKPAPDWAVVGKWNFPAWIRAQPSRAPSAARHRPKTSASTSTAFLPLPVFLSVHTVVTKPILSADNKVLDFGQTALGIRQVKSLRVRNTSDQRVRLTARGLNAVGPFVLLNAVRELDAGEWQQVVVECLPVAPGLIVEVLELGCADSGFILRITLKSYGVNPSIEITGLDAHPPDWNAKGGILDFGHVLCGDVVARRFVIENKSAFPVSACVTRALSEGLSSAARMELSLRTSSGLPLFTVRPEEASVEPEKALEVEVIFRPDRGRLEPFREDFNVNVGLADGLVPLGLCGRVWSRQLFVAAAEARDDTFARTMASGAGAAEDLQTGSPSMELRRGAADIRHILCMSEPASPALVLQFSDLYDDNVFSDLSSVEAVDLSQANNLAKANKMASAKNVIAAAGRSQMKGVLLGCARAVDGRPNSNAGGSYEVIFGTAAKESGFFSVSSDKGTVAVGALLPLEFVCTLPKPRGLGGLQVGSWRSFPVEIVLKGGWRPDGEPEETKVTLTLKAFVRL